MLRYFDVFWAFLCYCSWETQHHIVYWTVLHILFDVLFIHSALCNTIRNTIIIKGNTITIKRNTITPKRNTPVFSNPPQNKNRTDFPLPKVGLLLCLISQKQHTYTVFGQKRRTVTFYQNYRSYVVAVSGFEPLTLRVWTACSSQLSYTAVTTDNIILQFELFVKYFFLIFL